jgi:hypothetical protein
MKCSLLLMSTVVLLTACNSGPKSTPVDKNSLSDSLRLATDTAGLADYQAWKAQNELGEKQQQAQEKAPASTTPKKAASGQTAGTSQASGTSSTGSGTAAQEKKGWSKTAKGAVIGGVVGAGTGAVVNKKNRAAGAVVGGVIGAGAGAIIGNEMDKKDGRH